MSTSATAGGILRDAFAAEDAVDAEIDVSADGRTAELDLTLPGSGDREDEATREAFASAVGTYLAAVSTAPATVPLRAEWTVRVEDDEGEIVVGIDPTWTRGFLAGVYDVEAVLARVVKHNDDLHATEANS